MRTFQSIVNVYINSSSTSRALQSEGRDGLEDDLDEFLGAEGCCSGGGAGGGMWNVDLDIEGSDDWEGRVARLVEFLRAWGVPTDTTLTVLPPMWEPGQPTREVPVFPSAPDAEPGAAADPAS
jgi:hypothetical protein